jgi:anti-anti-sigma regulatory factor
MDVTKGENGEVVIRIDGTFDAKAASRLAGWLVEVPRDGSLVLDFTQVRICEDFGLASLASDLASRGRRLHVRGLTRHQERMLQYFGVVLNGEEARARLNRVGS